MRKKEYKVGVLVLAALVVGSMIGGGFFDLPGNMARKASLKPMLIALSISFVGMLCLAFVFKELSTRKPKLDAGVYSYAKHGFGNYMGFTSAWGYWVSSWIGNLSLLIMMCAAMSIFFPSFGDGTTREAITFSSSVMWGMTILCAFGVKSASLINLFTTIIKVIGVVILLSCIAIRLDLSLFESNFMMSKLAGSSQQVQNVVLITLWSLVGVECASAFSAHAKTRQTVGIATVLGLLTTFTAITCLSILPFGLFKHEDIAAFTTPSTARIMQYLVGDIGRIFISVSLLISASSCLLAWTLLTAEVPYIAYTKDKLFPHVFGKVNSHKSPIGALIITAVAQQMSLLVIHLTRAGYLDIILAAVPMVIVPYLCSSAYSSLLCIKGETFEHGPKHIKYKVLAISVISFVYCSWALYASTIHNVTSTLILFGVGTVVYVVMKMPAL